jgi:hypothetical protein
MSVTSNSPTDEMGRATMRHALAPAIDHDQAAATGRSRRSIVDIDRVAALAAAHRGDPDWDEIAIVLEHLRATLSHDLGLPERGNRPSTR